MYLLFKAADQSRSRSVRRTTTFPLSRENGPYFVSMLLPRPSLGGKSELGGPVRRIERYEDEGAPLAPFEDFPGSPRCRVTEPRQRYVAAHLSDVHHRPV